MQTNQTPIPGRYEEIRRIRTYPQDLGDSPTNSDNRKLTKRKFLRYFLIALAILSTICFVATLAVLFEKEIRHHMEALLLWLADHKSRGFLIFLGVEFVGVPLLFPVSLITLAGGFIFSDEFGMVSVQVSLQVKGVLLCSFFSFVAIQLGSMISFALSRFCCASVIQKYCIHRFKLTRALDRGFQKHGIKLVALMRMSFMVPFNIFNYVMGTTSISFFDFTLGSLALILNVTVQILLGASVNSISDIIQGKYHGSIIFEVVFVFGLVMALIMIIVVARITRAQLRQLTNQEECQNITSCEDEVPTPDTLQ